MQGTDMAAMARRQANCGSGGGGGGADTLIALMRQGQGDDGTGPAQARRGQCDNGVTTEVTGERGNSLARAPFNNQRRQGRGGAMVEQS
jgi:hypothetical protein